MNFNSIEIQAGVSKVNITPPIGCLMGGYGGREHGCVEIHDELYTRALYFKAGNNESVVVSSDLCGLVSESVNRIRNSVNDRIGIPKTNIILNCTHTHCGPAYRNPEDEITRRHLRSMEDKITGAIVLARNSSEPAKLGWGREQVLCGVNRREKRGDKIVIGVNPEGPVAPWVEILKVSNLEDSLMGVLFCHPCHPNVMGGYEISADFAGVAEKFVEEHTDALALYIQGCCGNIAPAIRRRWDVVEKMGTKLGAAIVKQLTDIEPDLSKSEISVLERTIYLPVEDLPPVEEAEAHLKKISEKLEKKKKEGETKGLEVLESQKKRAEEKLEVAKNGLDKPGLPMTIVAKSIGDFAIVGIPAEVCIELGERIRKQSDFSSCIVAGYTNGAQGYFPPGELFEEGGYEVTARCKHMGLGITEQAGEVLVEEALKLLKEL